MCTVHSCQYYVIYNFLRANYHSYAALSSREKDVIRQLAKGLTSAEIAEELFIAGETVKTHRKNISQKLKINSAHELLNYARAFDLA